MRFLAKLPDERFREVVGAILLALTLFLFVALVTDGAQGARDRHLENMGAVSNYCGWPGAVVAGVLYVGLGHASHVLYFLTGVWSFMLLRHREVDRVAVRILGMLLMVCATAGLLHVDLPAFSDRLPGGALGAYTGHLLESNLGVVGANILGIVLGVVGILLATEFLLLSAYEGLRAAALVVLHAHYVVFLLFCYSWRKYFTEVWEHRRRFKEVAQRLLSAPQRLARRSVSVAGAEEEDEAPFPSVTDGEQATEEPRDLSRIRIGPATRQEPLPFPDPLASDPEPDAQTEEPAAEAKKPAAVETAPEAAKETGQPEQVRESAPVAPAAPKKSPQRILARRRTAEEQELPPDYVYPRHYKRPPLSLLDPQPAGKIGDGLAEMLRHTSVLVEQALQTHGIEARVTDVTRGPTITRFELEPAPGIKVNRFIALEDDLALALKAFGVRVEAPIPGKGRVGIELPNAEREPVMLRDLLESRAFRKHRGQLVLALGKDIAGEVVAVDLTTMPHLLVAGATGSGKTVCLKTILASLLFMKTPEELQMVLVDPKMVEMSIFNDVPHLITPVVIDAKKAASALNWLINEMEERYRLFAQLRVRNIEVYNESVENGEIEIPESEGLDRESVDVIRKLPYIVCVIDELADLMMLARSEVEDAIMRLAQLARAVGIHLIIATQRPSVNVLTGVIKANFPVRIAFQVSSKVDSRCILDEMGAERLIGRGDMLYLPAGKASPTRIQGAFVSDHEMESLIGYLKTQAPPQYRDEVQNFGKAADALEDLANETDELLDDAVRVVLDTGQASISMVQRRLRVGYTRAARLIDMMELKGIVGPHVGSKAREILIDCAPAEPNA